MLRALLRLIRTCWTPAALYLSSLWGWLLCSNCATNVKTLEVTTLKLSGVETSPLELDNQGFPDATDDQVRRAKRTFIESFNFNAICALASRYNDEKHCRVIGKDNGSFNVCFFIEFDPDGSKWMVRVPFDVALENTWEKLLSEVTTMQYIERNTQIPVPYVHAYGRDAKLIENSSEMQMYLITDFVPGKPLDKNLLLKAEEEHRRNFYSQLIDILAELRNLEFSSIGSLMPNSSNSQEPILGPVISMSATTLRRPPLPSFTSATQYIRCQFRLISNFFLPPVADHTIDDIQAEVFALYGIERLFDQLVDPKLDLGPFVLSHLDLRCGNIIVDENQNIEAIIDCEFAGTVPLQVFTPPSWITGHDSIGTETQPHTQFRDVLNEKSIVNSTCDRLRREWYEEFDDNQSCVNRTDMAFGLAHVLRRPTDATDIYCDFFAPKLSNKTLDDSICEFFDRNPAYSFEVQRRVEKGALYMQYLKSRGLYETEVDKLLAKSKALKDKWGWS